jgi:ATP-binding cassette, subfamily C (CFTR/MRP), member 1
MLQLRISESIDVAVLNGMEWLTSKILQVWSNRSSQGHSSHRGWAENHRLWAHRQVCSLPLMRSIYTSRDLTSLPPLYSGKSSLLLTLLRMLRLQSGRIEFDGIDISQIPPNEIRQRCFVVVAQDPLLLPHEDLRFNLEPEESASDSMLIQTLKTVGLWSTFQRNDTMQDALESNDDASILDKKLSQFPKLSAGQCQLFALARAIAKVNSLRAAGARPIVVLDEITSSVDADTEAKIHSIVDSEISSHSHTVIIVTHRVGALADYVRVGRDVLVRMADGEVKEVVRDITPAVLR